MDFGNLLTWIDYNAGAITAVATVVLAVGGLFEGFLYIRFSKKRNTLDAIRQITSDPVVGEYQRKIKDKAKSGNGGIYDYSQLTQDDRVYVSRIMNEYETISLSVYQGMTDKSVIMEQCGSTIVSLVNTFVLGKEMEYSKPAGIYKPENARRYFPNMLKLYEQIKKEHETE